MAISLQHTCARKQRYGKLNNKILIGKPIYRLSESQQRSATDVIWEKEKMSSSNEKQQDKAVNELTPEELDAAIQTVLSQIISSSLINHRGWARSMLLSGMDVQTVVNILKNVIADEAVKKSLHDALIRAAQAENCDDKLIGRALAEFEHLEDHQTPAEQAPPKEYPPEEDTDETFGGPG